MVAPVITAQAAQAVEPWSTVTIAPNATPAADAYTFTVISGDVALTGAGATRTFAVPATWAGKQIAVRISAVRGVETSAPAVFTYNANVWSSWRLLANGNWVPRRSIRLVLDNVVATSNDIYDGGDPYNGLALVYDGGGSSTVSADVIDGLGTDLIDGNVTTTARDIFDGGTPLNIGPNRFDGNSVPIVAPQPAPTFYDALGAINFIDAFGASDLIDGSGI